VRALGEAGHEVTLVSPPGVDPLNTAVGVPLDKGNARETGIRRIWKWISRECPQLLFELIEISYNLYAALRLPLVFHRHPAAIYYERYAFFLFAGVVLAKWHGRPVILEVNEVVGVQRARGQILVRVARRLERTVFSRADEILTVSSFLQHEVLHRGGRPGHVHVVPNAIDPSRFDAKGSGQAIRHKLGLDGAIVMGFVGWFDHWDRLDLLVDVARELRDSHPALRLLLVGDGPVAEDLRGSIRRYGLERVAILTGAVTRAEVPQYIDAMDICVLPDSNPFGSPLVLFEFMASGKAVVTPDLPPIRDVIRDHATGLIVKPGDAASLREVIRRMADDARLRRQLGDQARRAVLENHTWAATARRIVALAAAHPVEAH
jgi:glycosyltransferase involved in cell wall biosynthesis